MRLYEVERGQGQRTKKAQADKRTDFEKNVSKLNTKRRSLDAEKTVKPVKPS